MSSCWCWRTSNTSKFSNNWSASILTLNCSSCSSNTTQHWAKANTFQNSWIHAKVALHWRVMLNDFEKRIYNEYLKSSRVAAGQPYKLRKNFDDIDPTSELYVKRVARVLNKFTNMSMQDFFRAPHVVYGSGERFDLKFFTSPRALKTYTLYM